MAERLGTQASNQKVAGLIPGVRNYVVSLGKALHPNCLGGNVPVLTAFQRMRPTYVGRLNLFIRAYRPSGRCNFTGFDMYYDVYEIV